MALSTLPPVALSRRYWKPAAILMVGGTALLTGLHQMAVWMTSNEARIQQWEADARTRPCPRAGRVPYVMRYDLRGAVFVTRWCRPPKP